MRFDLPAELLEIRAAVRELCARFPGEYWRGLEPDRYPTEFVTALTESGWLAALVPEEYGGAASRTGELRLQAFGEPTAGSDTPTIQTTAERVDSGYVVQGQKIWTSRAEHSDLMLLLARTTRLDQVQKRSEGLSTFLVDMRAAGDRLTIQPIQTMMNHATTEVFSTASSCPRTRLSARRGVGSATSSTG
jgi:acyl-CoA dehydrogenase